MFLPSLPQGLKQLSPAPQLLLLRLSSSIHMEGQGVAPRGNPIPAARAAPEAGDAMAPHCPGSKAASRAAGKRTWEHREAGTESCRDASGNSNAVCPFLICQNL